MQWRRHFSAELLRPVVSGCFVCISLFAERACPAAFVQPDPLHHYSRLALVSPALPFH